MRLPSILSPSSLFIAVTAALCACGGTAIPADAPADASSADVCPVVDAGPPPVCPEGCVWNGTECRQHQGIVMPDRRDPDGSP
ncbi:hypothetical protein BE21_44295 [Sorangium cellulosum]|uniref:Secreted protein n=1 Tax=Sorangium cellulosum TaxID=56 RepID=A0A150TJH9_SORCE|nr:hypothetical protein BE21_44295 [Sorangium cellulosum]